MGYNIGNTLEVQEAIATLNGNGPEDLTEICVALAANMLYLAEKGTYEECENSVRRVIKDKSALKTLADMVERLNRLSITKSLSRLELATRSMFWWHPRRLLAIVWLSTTAIGR